MSTIKLARFLDFLKGSLLHPQWLSDRYHLLSRRKLRAIKKGLVFDVGSGNSDLRQLLDPSISLVRIDYPSTNALYNKKPDIYADAKCLPVSDQCADGVLLLEVIEHIFDYKVVFRECHRILSSEGILCISVPFIYPIHDSPYDFHRFTRYGLENELHIAGFDVMEVLPHGNSIIVAMQMFNLSLLEIAKKCIEKNLFVGVCVSSMVYIVCVLNNVLSFPFLSLKFNNSAVFGYFIIATPAG